MSLPIPAHFRLVPVTGLLNGLVYRTAFPRSLRTWMEIKAR